MGLIILIVIILAIVALFSVQNASPVAISFLFWRFEASLAIVIFLTVLIGVIVGGILVYALRSKGDTETQKRT
jgi:uncharacterized integral membrane protein